MVTKHGPTLKKPAQRRHTRQTEKHEKMLAALREHPIMAWAINYAGLSKTSVTRLRQRDPEFDRAVRAAQAIGQRRRLEEASPERVLAWSDRETFSLRQEVHQTGQQQVVIQLGQPDALALGTNDITAIEDGSSDD